MKPDEQIKAKIRQDVKRSYQMAKNADHFIWEFRANIERTIINLTDRDYADFGKVGSELIRITYLSKTNKYNVRQYLNLVVQLVEGVVRDYRTALMNREKQKITPPPFKEPGKNNNPL